MKSNIKMWKLMVLAGAMLFLSDIAYAKSRTQDSVPGYKPDTDTSPNVLFTDWA